MRGTSVCKLIFALSPLVTTPHCGTVYYRVCVSREYPGKDRETGIHEFREGRARENGTETTVSRRQEVKRTERGVGHVKQEERKEKKREKKRESDGRGEWPCSDTDH